MMPSLIVDALRELGPRQLGLYAVYQLGVRLGYYRRVLKTASHSSPQRVSLDWLALPERDDLVELLGDDNVRQILAEADEIVAGQVRLFGSEPVPLCLSVDGPISHWTDQHSLPANSRKFWQSDIKFIWEPGRFGWAYTLGRAYYLSADERFAEAFWRKTELFLESNPPYMGPHWASAQEAALRLMALVFALRIFRDSAHTTPERTASLAAAISNHAERIPPTLVYARAQNNNHLLTEAAGLYTAGLALPGHPDATRWRTLGWRWFNRGVVDQVARDGAYAQHSANYQRLMLQVGLWVNKLANADGQALPEATRRCLRAATRWLSALLDPENGCIPNLGPNDGAYILPLTVCSFHDYRPVLRAANRAFLDRKEVDLAPGDEMTLWLVDTVSRDEETEISEAGGEPAEIPQTIRLKRHPSWAYLRAARFTGRPGHADQLHLDLWWRGLNVAQDPGTYLYNAPPPWDNALTRTQVHNTLTVNGQEQMQRAGRFLYLKRAQAAIVSQESDESGDWQRLVAQHDGYRRLGVTHRRSVTGYETGRWVVDDRLLTSGSRATDHENSSYEVCLHWLLPDWSWEVDEAEGDRFVLYLVSPYGPLKLTLAIKNAGEQNHNESQVQLARAGELIYGSGEVDSTWGWSSPTYGDKIPALALRWKLRGLIPLSLRSEWLFP
jgi:hypothetical protein